MSTEANSLFSGLLNKLGDLGFFIRRNITGLGYAARMFALVLFRSGSLLKRPRLVSDQVLFVSFLLKVLLIGLLQVKLNLTN